MAQDTVKMKFTGDVVFNEKANQGLGEHQARFVIVKPGEEAKAESIMKAFKAAGAKNLHARGGVVTLSQKNIDFRIAQLKGQEKHAETVAELRRGVEKIKEVKAAAKAAPAKPATRQQAGVGARQ